MTAILSASDFSALRSLASRWEGGLLSSRCSRELHEALNEIAARSTSGPDFLEASVNGDSIPEMEAAALLLAACLYGPEAKLEVAGTGTVYTHHRAAGERFTANVRVRCLNYEEVRK
jgi:hypothetical protein